MRHQQYIDGLPTFDVWALQRLDLGNQHIEPLLHLHRTLPFTPVGTVLAAVTPDVERSVRIQAAAFAVLSDLGWEPAFVHSIAPLGETLVGAHGNASRGTSGKEEGVGAGGTDSGGDEDVGEARGVNQTAGAEEGAGGGEDLGFAAGSERDLGDAGVAAVDGPFSFAVAGEEDARGGHGCGGGGYAGEGLEGGVVSGGGGLGRISLIEPQGWRGLEVRH